MRDAIRLCHPDVHPPERRELATAVTPKVSLRLRVAGVPSGSANGLPERRWKEALEEAQTPHRPDGDQRALRLRFILPPVAPGRPGADLDNLVDPVLSVLVGRLGWFGHIRPSIGGIEAAKERGSEPGCELELLAGLEPSKAVEKPLLDAVYEGALPRSARDEPFTDWVRARVLAERRPGGPDGIGVSLVFGDPRVNLGDIATGRPKNVIDCLWPILGGVAGAPDDHLVTALRLSRDDSLGGNSVRVTVWSPR